MHKYVKATINDFNLSENQVNQLDKYASLLKEYNKVMNLTGIDEYEEVYLKHFYDSLTICSDLEKINWDNLADLGTGAGFPGMVLAIKYPNKKIYLIEPITKRTNFLQIVVDELELDNVVIINKRMEDVEEIFDVIVSRAVAQLNILLELAIPSIKVGGYFIALKGAKGSEEVKQAANALKVLDTCVVSESEIDLLDEKGKRINVVCKKINKTNDKYPRNFGQIKKNPL